jgi:hypothetical protein
LSGEAWREEPPDGQTGLTIHGGADQVARVIINTDQAGCVSINISVVQAPAVGASPRRGRKNNRSK